MVVPQRSMTGATLLSALAVFSIATVFILGGFEEDAAIKIEVVHAEDAAPESENSAAITCKTIRSQLKELHETFWHDAKQRIVRKKGAAAVAVIERDFTQQVQNIDSELAKHGCASGATVVENEAEPCDVLRQERHGVAETVKQDVEALLANDKAFGDKKHFIESATKDLQARLAMLHCSAVEVISPAATKKAAHKSSQTDDDVQRLLEVEDAEKKSLQDAEHDVLVQKRRMARHLAEDKKLLEKSRFQVTKHQQQVAKIKKKVHVVQWAAKQRHKLYTAKEAKEGAAPEKQEPTVDKKTAAPKAHAEVSEKGTFEDDLDGSIAMMFEKHYEKPQAAPESLMQLSPSAEHAVKHSIPTMSKSRAAEAASATADAMEAVHEEVHSAAHSAAIKATVEAEKKGLGFTATKAYVRKKARAAAKVALTRSRAVFAKALQGEPTPELKAARRLSVKRKELVQKKSEQQKAKKEVAEKDKKTEQVMREETAKDKHIKAAAENAVVALKKQAKDTNDQVLAKGLANTKQQMAAAEEKAVSAEVQAWHKDVNNAMSEHEVLAAIAQYKKAHVGVSLPKAAQKWEENQVLKLKKRYARHFAKSLTLNPASKAGQLAALHEADREKVNVEKMILSNAEIQSILAKRNAEKSKKSDERMREAAKRYHLAATAAVTQKVKAIHDVTKEADQVQKRAIAKVLAKDASETLKAKTEANKAKAEAKHAQAAKQEALTALATARKKLEKLSKTAAAGTALLGTKLRQELKAQQQQVAAKVAKVKEETTKEVQASVKRAEAEKEQEKFKKLKAELQAQAANQTTLAETHAADVVRAAMEAAKNAKAMALHEQKAAARARKRSKMIADEATERARAVKAAAAQQVATLAKQKTAALAHFKEFAKSLKDIETQKSAKAEEIIMQKSRLAEDATHEAARAARFAEQQMAAGDLQKSSAAISKVDAAGATLQGAIDLVRSVDIRARGEAAIAGEKEALVEEREEKLKKKQAALDAAKENKLKLDLAAKESKTKTIAAAKENAKKKVLKEKKTKHDKIANEAFQKGVEHAKAVFASGVQSKARAAAKAQAAAVESRAKKLLKVADAAAPLVPPAPAPKTDTLTPTEEEVRRLTKREIAEAASGDSAANTVERATDDLTKYMHSHGGVHAEKEVKKAKLDVESAAAAQGNIGTAKAKATVAAAAAAAAAHAQHVEQHAKPAVSAPKVIAKAKVIKTAKVAATPKVAKIAAAKVEATPKPVKAAAAKTMTAVGGDMKTILNHAIDGVAHDHVDPSAAVDSALSKLVGSQGH